MMRKFRKENLRKPAKKNLKMSPRLRQSKKQFKEYENKKVEIIVEKKKRVPNRNKDFVFFLEKS